MYKIDVINPCGCVRKRKAWQKELVFETKDEAMQTASKMCTQGNEKFCKRHSFTLKEDGDTIKIVCGSKK